MKKAIIKVQGHVQGVGFRYSTKLIADKLGVYGTVANMMDGSVLIKIATSDEKADAFIRKLQEEKSPFSRIDTITVSEDCSLPDFNSFRVVH